MKQLLFFFFLAASASFPAQHLWQFNKDTVIAWHYQWGDEFNGAALNTERWNYSYGWTRSIYGNKEQQYYSDGDNHRVSDGVLNLDAEKHSVEKKVVDWRAENDSIMDNGKFNGFNKRNFNYTAGLIQSKPDFQYGYFEIKFKMPAKKGYWPAFWLYGGEPNEEIDMMELKTEKKNKIHVGRHSTRREENYLRDGLSKKAWGEWVTFKGDLTAGYNIVAGEWDKDYIKYFLNGECIAYTALNLNHRKVIVANIAVPANNGPFKPGPADSTRYSGNFEIDYIRVWSKEQITTNAATADSAEAERMIGTSELRSKRKFIYGAKNAHKLDGFTVSWMPEKNGYHLTVVGRELPDDASFKVLDQDKREITSGKLLYGTTPIKPSSPKPAFIELNGYGLRRVFSL